MSRLLPVVMIVLSVGASLVYFFKGDVRHGVYWAAAAALNSAVTF